MRWEDHSLAELKTVAKAYKKHISIGAVSKMKKSELIAVLDKHLRIDENNKIKVRAEEEKPLMGPNLMKQKEKRLKKKKKEATPPPSPPPSPPPARKELSARDKMRMEVAEIRKASAEAGYYKPMALSDRDRLRLRAEIAGMKRDMPRSLTEAEREQMEMDIESEMTNPIQPMTEMEREARAINERNKIKWTEEKRRGMLGQQQMMGAIADAMAIQAPEMPPRAFAQMLSAISDAMAIKAPETGVYRQTAEGTRSRAEYDRLTYLMRKANK